MDEHRDVPAREHAIALASQSRLAKLIQLQGSVRVFRWYAYDNIDTLTFTHMHIYIVYILFA